MTNRRRVASRRRSTAATVLALAAVTSGLLAPPAHAQGTLRIAAYNIKHGEGMDGVVDLRRAADVLRALDADVITLQEIDRGTERTDRVDQARRLGELLGMEAHFGDFMPYQGGEYGMAVLSRLPIRRVENIRLPDGDEPRTALEVEVAIGPEARPVSVVGIHFYRTPEERLAQAEALSVALDAREHPVVLAGDFNSFRGDIVMSALRREEWYLVDKQDSPMTFPADAPAREIDFVLLRPAGAFEIVEHRVIEEKLVSDHRPLVAVLRLW